MFKNVKIWNTKILVPVALLRQTGEYLQQKDIVKNSSTNWDVSLYTRSNSTALGCCQINFHIYLY